MTNLFCLSLVLRFNKFIDSIYNHSPCEVDVIYKTVLSYVILAGFAVDSCIYICISERYDLLV